MGTNTLSKESQEFLIVHQTDGGSLDDYMRFLFVEVTTNPADYLDTTNNAIQMKMNNFRPKIIQGFSLDFGNDDSSVSSWFAFWFIEQDYGTSKCYFGTANMKFNKDTSSFASADFSSSDPLILDVTLFSGNLAFPSLGLQSTSWPNYYIFGYLSDTDFEGNSIGLEKDFIAVSDYYGSSSSGDLIPIDNWWEGPLYPTISTSTVYFITYPGLLDKLNTDPPEAVPWTNESIGDTISQANDFGYAWSDEQEPCVSATLVDDNSAAAIEVEIN